MRGRQSSLVLVAALTVHLLVTIGVSARTISFSGRIWDVRYGIAGDPGNGPGNGCWSDDPASVWVDSSGFLHLKIRQLADGSWCQAQVIAQSYADYGDHLFWTNSRLDLLPSNVVFSGYLYANDNHEIDIEMTRSFGTANNLWYTVQPYSSSAPKSTTSWPLVLTGNNGDSYSSHHFVWSSAGSVSFESWYGHCLVAPCGGLIAAWPYSGLNTPASSWHLRPSINLWINNGTVSSPQEVIVASYSGPQIPHTFPNIEVTTPNGGETWSVGSPHTVTWTSSALSQSGQLYIILSQDGGLHEYPTPIAVLDPSVTSYSWTPLAAHVTTAARLAVGNFVNGDYEAFDWSNQNFTIATVPPQSPTVTTNAASNFTQTSTTVAATVNPNGASTTLYFDYGPTTSYGSTGTYGAVGSGTTAQTQSLNLTNLTCGTTYQYKARAQNSGGTNSGGNQTFTTSACPQQGTTQLITNGTFGSGSSGWVLSGSFFADSRFSVCHSCPGYAYLANSDGSPGNNLSANLYQTITIPANATSAGVSFWWYITTSETLTSVFDRMNVTIQNSSGGLLATIASLSNLSRTNEWVQNSADLMAYRGQTIRLNFSATTDISLPTVFRVDDASILVNAASAAPTVATGSASAIGQTSATLSGTVNPNGASTTLYFDYGPTTSYGSLATLGNIGSGTTSVTQSLSVNGLSCGTTYQFRARAENSGGTNSGGNQAFTTSACPQAPVIGLSVTTMTFSEQQGGGGPLGQALTISNTGGGTLNWSISSDASWLVPSSTNGTTPQTISVFVNNGLTAGTYQGTLTVSSPGASNSPRVAVTLVVTPPPPPTCTSFTINPSSATPGPAADSQSVTITGSPAGCLNGNWSTSGNASWLTVSPLNGSGTGVATVSWGQYTGTGLRSDHAMIANNTFSVTQSAASTTQFVQQGPKLVATDAAGITSQGYSVSLSGDGNTTIVSGRGAAWIFTRSGGVWTQQGTKLIGTGAVGDAGQGNSVSIAANDGSTAIVGGYNDNSGAGAAWVFTRSGGVWSQQGGKLVGTGASSDAQQGYSVSISTDGNTALIGGYHDNNNAGAAWVFTRSGGVWTQQQRLFGSGATGNAEQGTSVSLSADGNTALVGAQLDNSSAGAAWVFTRSGGVWTQQGTKLAGSGAVGTFVRQGYSVCLSGDGNTAIIGGPFDNSNAGAAWVFTRSGGVWTPQGAKLVGFGATSDAQQGFSVSLSANGNTAILGGQIDSNSGAAWVFARSGGVWTPQGTKLLGSDAVGNAREGWSVSVSGDGSTAIVGGISDNSSVGAAWVYTNQGSNGSPLCTSFQINPPSANPGFASGSVPVAITGSPSGCIGGSWSASGNGSYLTVSPSTGIGSSSTIVSWEQNLSTTARSGNATIAGQTFTVNQGGASQSAPRVRNDFNGDGRSDILWRNSLTGSDYLYQMNGLTIATLGEINVTSDQNWKIVGTGDFDGDGKADVLWRHSVTGANYMYLMNGFSLAGAGQINTVADANWNIVGVGDFDGDGKADILWRNSVTGSNFIYLMNGLSIKALGEVNVIADQNWQIVGVADFDGDGKADILWRNSVTGSNYMYLMNGMTIRTLGQVNVIGDQNWKVVGAGDFDGDGKADILWRNLVTGDDYIYEMNGFTIKTPGAVNTVNDPNWMIVATGDYNGDGKADILWRNNVTGSDYMYLMNGFSIVTLGQVNVVNDPNWKILY
ncbi:MAG: hypothetical protein QOK37_1757 [Thermoanaerobaculia bacterium]|jgi:hypothetical protein|nr:hypothetical protein [Thermoanaerobaculia bacterium]